MTLDFPHKTCSGIFKSTPPNKKKRKRIYPAEFIQILKLGWPCCFCGHPSVCASRLYPGVETSGETTGTSRQPALGEERGGGQFYIKLLLLAHRWQQLSHSVPKYFPWKLHVEDDCVKSVKSFRIMKLGFAADKNCLHQIARETLFCLIFTSCTRTMNNLYFSWSWDHQNHSSDEQELLLCFLKAANCSHLVIVLMQIGRGGGRAFLDKYSNPSATLTQRPITGKQSLTSTYGQKSTHNWNLNAKKWHSKVKPQSCQKTVNAAVKLTLWSLSRLGQ